MPYVPPSPGIAGSSITMDDQLELWKSTNDIILIGANTPFHMTKIKGLGRPSSNYQDFDRLGSHGVFPVKPETLQKRVIQGEIIIINDVDFVAKLDYFNKFFGPSNNIITLHIKWPGRNKLVTSGYPREAQNEYDAEYIKGGAQIIIWEFTCPDPIWYDAQLTTTSSSITAGNPSVNSAPNNIGNIAVEPTLTFIGPATDPTFLNAEDSERQIRLKGIFTASDTVKIDIKNRRVTVNDVIRNDVIRNDNQWWKLKPGVNNITFTRANTNGQSNLDIAFRSGWLGL